MDEILQESKDLDLIISHYTKKNQIEKARKHIKRVVDGKVRDKYWTDVARSLRKYQQYLSEQDKKQYVNRIVKQANTFQYSEAAFIIIEDFSDLVNDKKFSTFLTDAIYHNTAHLTFPKLDYVYGLIEKHKERVSKSELAPKLAKVLALALGLHDAKKEEIEKFEPYLGNKNKCFLAIRALTYNSKRQNEIFNDYKHYLSSKYACNMLEEAISKELKSMHIHCHEIGMQNFRNAIALMEKDFLKKEQTSKLVNKVAEAQLNFVKPPSTLNDFGRRIVYEDADPEYGTESAFETLKQFPDYIDNKLAKKIMRKYLAKKFFEEANSDFKTRKKESVKHIIREEQKRFADKETVGGAFADALIKDLNMWSEDSKVMKKFSKYANQKYISEALIKLLESTRYIFKKTGIIKNYGHYLSEDQLKEAVNNIAEKYAIDCNYKGLASLIENTKSRFSDQELTQLFKDLFKQVTKKANGQKTGRQVKGKIDVILEFLDEFSSYVPRNGKTEAYYQLLDIKKASSEN